MSNYIKDGTTSQGSPTGSDVYPKQLNQLYPSVPNIKKVRPADYNILNKALQDTREWFQATFCADVTELRTFEGVADGAPAFTRDKGYYYWDASSTADDDGTNVIQATGIVTGRWIKTVGSVGSGAGHVANIGTADEPLGLRGTNGAVDGDVIFAHGFYAAGDGGGGDFYWDASSTDTDDGGTIIAPTGVSTGRWIRSSIARDGIYSVKFFGAKGNWHSIFDPGDDDTAAVQAAIDAIANRPINATGTLFFPVSEGEYQLTDNLTISNTMRIRGEVAEDGGTGSTASLRWQQLDEDVFFNGMTLEADAQGSIIENLQFNGAYPAPGGVWPVLDDGQMDQVLNGSTAIDPQPLGSGLVIHAPRVQVRKCAFNSWLWDAINAEGVDAEDNANDLVVQWCTVNTCGRHGVFLAGGNASNGVITMMGSNSGGGYTVYDRSFLGNTMIGCHSEGYRHSYYSSSSTVQNSVFLGCYQEASDGPALLGPNTVCVGGTWANGITTNGVAPPMFMGNLPGGSVGLQGCAVYSELWPPMHTYTSGGIAATDAVALLDASGGNISVNTVDPSAGFAQKWLILKRIDSVAANTCTMSTLNAKNFDNDATLLLRPNETVFLVGDGSNWRVISRHPGYNWNLNGRSYASGTALSSGDFTLTGFGSTASVGSISGYDSACVFTVTAGGTGITADPTVKLTYADGTWTTAPIVSAYLQTGTQIVPITWAVTATDATITLLATPIATETYTFVLKTTGL